VLKELEKVPLPPCGATTTVGETPPIGDQCPNTISQREPNDEADYESDCEAGRHQEATLALRVEFQRSGCDATWKWL
jgi:hypothetical protein